MWIIVVQSQISIVPGQVHPFFLLCSFYDRWNQSRGFVWRFRYEVIEVTAYSEAVIVRVVVVRPKHACSLAWTRCSLRAHVREIASVCWGINVVRQEKCSISEESSKPSCPLWFKTRKAHAASMCWQAPCLCWLNQLLGSTAVGRLQSKARPSSDWSSVFAGVSSVCCNWRGSVAHTFASCSEVSGRSIHGC